MAAYLSERENALETDPGEAKSIQLVQMQNIVMATNKRNIYRSD
jgi:hypothetical protein